MCVYVFVCLMAVFSDFLRDPPLRLSEDDPVGCPEWSACVCARARAGCRVSVSARALGAA